MTGFRSIRGAKLAYEIIGDQGDWVALSPGGRRPHNELLRVAKKIAAYGFRVVLHDRRNTGVSTTTIEGEDSEEIMWVDDLAALLKDIGATPAFIGGFSSGARLAMRTALRHPNLAKGLLLCRVTGGAVAAQRLPDKYYGAFVRLCEDGGMEAVVGHEHYQERIKMASGLAEQLLKTNPGTYIETMSRWKEAFQAGAHHSVMGISDADLEAIEIPALVIPGNDATHNLASGLDCAARLPNSCLHQLEIADSERELIPFTEWDNLEDAIATAFAGFMREVVDTDAPGVGV